jgi:hypothetical protein
MVLKSADVIQVQGTLTDAQGTAITSAEDASVEFTSPLNPGTSINTDASGNYSVALLTDQNFTAAVNVYPDHGGAYLNFNALPVGTLSASQTYNLTPPTTQLTFSLRDASTGVTLSSSKIILNCGGYFPVIRGFGYQRHYRLER